MPDVHPAGPSSGAAGTVQPSVRPATVPELQDIVNDAVAAGTKLRIAGGGSKAKIGDGSRDCLGVDMTGFAGVIDYDPAELVLTVGAGTPLTEVEALVDAQAQRLAFDPFDHGPLFGAETGRATIGGIVAAGVAGSRRLSAGSVRDHLLGFQAVSGHGTSFVAGAKVVKNVTGYDLPKLACASWGRLWALTSVTLKVLPKPQQDLTLVLDGLDVGTAQRAMSQAMMSPADVAAAAHMPGTDGGSSVTAFKLEGFGPSITSRSRTLAEIFGSGAVRPLAAQDAATFWSDLKVLRAFQACRYLWRVNVPPSAAPGVIEDLRPYSPRWVMDWAGGLIWISGGFNAGILRRAVTAHGGHAMLVKAPREMRHRVSALHPPLPGIAALSQRVRRAFDPAGVFETGRFLDEAPGGHAGSGVGGPASP